MGTFILVMTESFFGHFCNCEIHIEKSCRFLYNVGKEG